MQNAEFLIVKAADIYGYHLALIRIVIASSNSCISEL